MANEMLAREFIYTPLFLAMMPVPCTGFPLFNFGQLIHWQFYRIDLAIRHRPLHGSHSNCETSPQRERSLKGFPWHIQIFRGVR